MAWYLVCILAGFIGGLISGYKMKKPAVEVSKIKQKGGSGNNLNPEIEINPQSEKKKKKKFSLFKNRCHEKN